MKETAATRELRYRQRVYPRRVSAGQMTQQLADRQIAIMAAIAADYDQLANADEQAERLL